MEQNDDYKIIKVTVKKIDGLDYCKVIFFSRGRNWSHTFEIQDEELREECLELSKEYEHMPKEDE